MADDPKPRRHTRVRETFPDERAETQPLECAGHRTGVAVEFAVAATFEVVVRVVDLRLAEFVACHAVAVPPSVEECILGAVMKMASLLVLAPVPAGDATRRVLLQKPMFDALLLLAIGHDSFPQPLGQKVLEIPQPVIRLHFMELVNWIAFVSTR